MQLRLLSLYLILPLSLLVFGCGDDDGMNGPPAPAEQPYLVSSQHLFDLSKSTLQFAAAQEPKYAAFASYIKHDVSLYKVEYRANYKGGGIVASGLLCLPKASSDTFPLLSAQHGTEFRNEGLPSQISQTTLLTSPQPYPLFASAGYVTLAPDYIGFGSSSAILHPYYNRQYSAEACVNLIKAGKELASQMAINLSGKLFLAGYSEGGYVTLATMQEIESEPISGFTLTATAAGAGGYNLERIMDTILTKTVYPSPNYIGYILHSYDQTNDWSRTTSDMFQAPYAQRIPNLYDGSNGGGDINSELNDTIPVLLQSAFIANALNRNDQELINALQTNSVHNWKPTTPLRLYHGTDDKVVPPYDSRLTYENFVSLGATSVEHKPLQGEDHGSALFPFAADILPWFESLK